MLAVLPVLAVAGCSADDPAPSAARADATAGPAQRPEPGDPPPPFTGVRHRLPAGAALDSDPDLYGRVALTGCAATARGWRAVGTAHNPGGLSQTLQVVVLFTDAHARAVDSATTTVPVPAGSTRTWTAERRFETTPGTRCVVRAVRLGK